MALKAGYGGGYFGRFALGSYYPYLPTQRTNFGIPLSGPDYRSGSGPIASETMLTSHSGDRVRFAAYYRSL